MDQLETAETILGIGYITLQTYIAGAIADLKAVFPFCQKPPELMAMSLMLGNTQTTVIEAVWCLANYFKHHDEWPDWKAKGPRRTIETLNRLGINEETEFPCIELMKVLASDQWRFLPLMQSCSDWRESLFAALRRQQENDVVPTFRAKPH